tara:strand:+ start:1836 stop:2888 length:1053 start_codon:yes stop_codon:yes gene_type:complete
MNLFFKLLKSVFNIQKFNSTNALYHRQAKALLAEFNVDYSLSGDDNLPHNVLLKMQWYMAEFIYSAEMLNDLLGQKSTDKEQRTYLLSGAVVAICDLIIDDLNLTSQEIENLKRPSKDKIYERDIFKLYQSLYHAFFDNLGAKKSLTLHYYELLYDAQIRSKKQFDSSISKSEVDEICIEKGGYSLLYIRALLNEEFYPDEEKTWFEIGGYIQFCNDAQDLHKDLLNKLRTFGSCRSSLEEIAIDLDQQKVVAFSLLKSSPYQKQAKDFLLFTLHSMGIGILAKLHQYHLLCNKQYSSSTLASKTKSEVRPMLRPIKLIPYWFPRILKYQYQKVNQPFNFKFNLQNAKSN